MDLRRADGLLNPTAANAAEDQHFTRLAAVWVDDPSELFRGLRADRPLNHLWRLSKCPDKRTPHSFAVPKTVLSGNFIGRESAGLHHQPC